MHFEQWVRAAWSLLEAREPVDADHDYTQAEVRTVMSAAVQALVDELACGGQLSVNELGQLLVKERPPRRVADNLRQGVYQVVEARKAVVFKPSAMLLRRINGKHIDD